MKGLRGSGGEGRERQFAGAAPLPFRLSVWAPGLSHLLGWVSGSLEAAHRLEGTCAACRKVGYS